MLWHNKNKEWNTWKKKKQSLFFLSNYLTIYYKRCNWVIIDGQICVYQLSIPFRWYNWNQLLLKSIFKLYVEVNAFISLLVESKINFNCIWNVQHKLTSSYLELISRFGIILVQPIFCCMPSLCVRVHRHVVLHSPLTLAISPTNIQYN